MSFKMKIVTFVEKLLVKRLENLAGYLQRIKEYQYFEILQERDDDIYIITFLKSGTTWMQMILYQMLHDGDMDFEHIYDVSPWLKNEAVNGKDAHRVNELPSPRVFKSHDPYDLFDEEGKSKFIFVYREGMDVAVSLNHHRRNYNNPDETLQETIDKYFSIEEEYNWFNFSGTWLANENGLDILYVSYEDLKSNLDKCLDEIAAFLNVELDAGRRARIKERSSFEFMKKHESKFGEQAPKKIVYDKFIRKGEVGEGKKVLTEEQQANFDKIYQSAISPLKNKLFGKN